MTELNPFLTDGTVESDDVNSFEVRHARAAVICVAGLQCVGFTESAHRFSICC